MLSGFVLQCLQGGSRTGSRDQIVGQNEPRPCHAGQRQPRFTGLRGEANLAIGGAEQAAAKALAATERLRQLDPSLEPAEAVIVFGSNQRAVDARGAYFEKIGARDRVGDIEKSRDGTADQSAIIDRHRGVVDPLGHHLQRRAAPAGHDDPNEAITHRHERRFDHLRDLVGVDQKLDLCSRNLVSP